MTAIFEQAANLENPDTCQHNYPPRVTNLTKGLPGHLYTCSCCGKPYKFYPLALGESPVRYIEKIKRIYVEVPTSLSVWEWVLAGIVALIIFGVGLIVGSGGF